MQVQKFAYPYWRILLGLRPGVKRLAVRHVAGPRETFAPDIVLDTTAMGAR
jgi:hypothetical protein